MTTHEAQWAYADLSLFQGNPYNELLTAPGVSWPGTYTAQVRAQRDEESELIATLGITAQVVGSDTVFTVTLSQVDSDAIPANSYWWDARHSSGMTRLQGQFIVKPTVTP